MLLLFSVITVVESDVINADETTIKVKTKEKKYKTHTGYYFGYIGDKKHACFEYRTNRSKDGPNKFLEDFEGDYIQVDGYDGYNDVFRNSKIKRVRKML